MHSVARKVPPGLGGRIGSVLGSVVVWWDFASAREWMTGELKNDG